MRMIGSNVYSFCRVIVLSLSTSDDIILDVKLSDTKLSLDLDFFLDLVISIGSFADEVFGQPFDDIGIGDYRLRNYFGEELVLLTLIEVGEDIPLGSTSILSNESDDLAKEILDFLEKKKIRSRRDVSFSIKEEVREMIQWRNYQGQIPIEENANYDDWFIYNVLIIENGIPIINENFNQVKSSIKEIDSSILMAGFFTAISGITNHLQAMGIEDIILERLRIYIRTFEKRVNIVIFEVKDNISLPRKSRIYESADHFLLALNGAVSVMDSMGIDYLSEESSVYIQNMVKEAYKEGLINL